MKKFKEFINESNKDNSFPVYVHGSHAKEPNKDNSFPVYVHGSHAKRSKIDEMKSSFEDYDTELRKFGTDMDYKQHGDYEKLDNLHKELTDHYGVDTAMNRDQMGALTSYTTYSGNINKELVNAHESGLPVSSYTKEFIGKMDNALENAMPTPKKMTTYSGLGFDPRKRMNDEGVLHSPAYLSSSIRPGEALKHAKDMNVYDDDKPREIHVLKINHDENQPTGLYIGEHSMFPNEQEYITKRGINLHLDKEPEIHTLNDGSKVHIWNTRKIEVPHPSKLMQPKSDED